MWHETAQTHLDAGLPSIVFDLFYVTATRYDNGQEESIGAWTGAEPISLTVDGEARTYLGVGASLQVPTIQTEEGLDVQGQSVVINGLSDLTDALRLEYNVDQARADIHQLLMNAGLVVLGTRRLFSGTIDGASLQQQRGSGQMSLEVVSRSRRGTRTHVAMRDESRDPFFKYAAQIEGDKWG
ncbi:hypothetical protein [Tateyamaria sp.]|uniref:hypothetical protein n=1 Tax=Tateyamaria sp. TaxID=1929288 RepID=UPI003B21061A